MARAATFELARLVEAAREGRVYLGKTRCLEILLPYLDDITTCLEFACAVAVELKADWFNATIELSGIHYDEYGIRLSDGLLRRFGLDVSTWYVKFTVKEDEWGSEAIFLSLHPLEREMRCVGGVVRPETRREL